MQGGLSEAKMEARGGLTERNITKSVYICVCVVIHMLSANNSALCLGYK
jgi:hypothetical protein